MDAARNGNFTSSEIVALMANGKEKDSKGKPFFTYVDETNRERRLNRSLENQSDARPLSWGLLVEPFVFAHIGTNYRLCSKETIQHPTIDYWFGSPDAIKEDDGRTVCDIKAPQTLKSFCDLVDPFYVHKKTGIDWMNAIRDNHKDGEKFYWQIVSNAVITKSKYGELIPFVPYKSQLQEIRDLASMIDDPAEQRKYYWITTADDEYLPWIPDGGFYNNVNVCRFEIPNTDKWALEKRVKEGGAMLIERKPIIIS